MELRSQLEMQQTISRKKTLEIESVSREKDGSYTCIHILLL